MQRLGRVVEEPPILDKGEQVLHGLGRQAQIEVELVLALRWREHQAGVFGRPCRRIPPVGEEAIRLEAPV